MAKKTQAKKPKSKPTLKLTESAISSEPKKRARTPKTARAAGLSFERELANAIRDVFPEAERQIESQASVSNGTDLQGTDPYQFQCKNWQAYASVSTIEEVKIRPGNIPVLVTKGVRKDPMVVLPLDAFVDLLRSAYGVAPLKGNNVATTFDIFKELDTIKRQFDSISEKLSQIPEVDPSNTEVPPIPQEVETTEDEDFTDQTMKEIDDHINKSDTIYGYYRGVPVCEIREDQGGDHKAVVTYSVSHKDTPNHVTVKKAIHTWNDKEGIDRTLSHIDSDDSFSYPCIYMSKISMMSLLNKHVAEVEVEEQPEVVVREKMPEIKPIFGTPTELTQIVTPVINVSNLI